MYRYNAVQGRYGSVPPCSLRFNQYFCGVLVSQRNHRIADKVGGRVPCETALYALDARSVYESDVLQPSSYGAFCGYCGNTGTATRFEFVQCAHFNHFRIVFSSAVINIYKRLRLCEYFWNIGSCFFGGFIIKCNENKKCYG